MEAILETAAALFLDRGYEAVTMSAVAEGSGTAPGSLYRFFPTKAALADAVLDRYGTHLAEALDAILAEAADLSADAIALRLLALVRDLRAERSAVLPLLDTPGEGPARRRAVKAAMQRRLVAILTRHRGLAGSAADARAFALRKLMTSARAVEEEPEALQQAAEAEIRALMVFTLGRPGA